MSKLEFKPRMADFAEVLAAMDAATGSNALEHYLQAQEAVASDIVATDKFLRTLTETITTSWTGTGRQLHDLLPRPEHDKYWPEARGMAGKLRRVAPDLRKAGWHIQEIPGDPASKRAKSWVITPPNAGITDADLVTVQLAFEEADRDLQLWERRYLDAGADPSCAAFHAECAVQGVGAKCECDFARLPVKPEWEIYVARSQAIRQRLWAEVQRTGLDKEDADRLFAKRSAAAEEA